MDYLADGLGILGFALLLAKFIAAWHERKRIYGEPPWAMVGIPAPRAAGFIGFPGKNIYQ